MESFVAVDTKESDGGGGRTGGEAAGVEEVITVGHGGVVVEGTFLRQAIVVQEILDRIRISVVDIESESPKSLAGLGINPKGKCY